MTTAYPKGLDTFLQPSSPATTPLNSAGAGGNTRDHITWLTDAGDAIEALEKLGVPCFNVITYGGAKGDKRVVTDGATSTNTTLTSATAAFTAADVGKLVRIARASTAMAIPLTATIVSRTSATQVVVSLAADFTVSGKRLVIDGPTGRTTLDGATTAGSTTITSATAVFVAGDVGSTITIYEASATAHVTTIASVTNGTTAVLAAASTRTVTAANVMIATDDSAAFQTCLTAVQTAGGGAVIVPPAPNSTAVNPSFVVGDLNMFSNTILFGQGIGASMVEYIGSSATTWLLSVNSGSGGTTSVSGNQRNISVSDIQFIGPVPYMGGGPVNPTSMGTPQNNHLLNVNACSDMQIERCKFTGFMGDGVYIGSSNSGATERHNERISVKYCVFDGVNKNNRNGVSVIDCDGADIDHCRFYRTTRPDMPGAIDIEPNNPTATYPVTRDINVTNCRFDDIGGGIMGCIGINLGTAQSSLVVAARNFHFTHNTMVNCLATPLYVRNANGVPTYSVLANDVWFTDNQCLGKAVGTFSGGNTFELDKGVRGVHILRNKFENYFAGAQIGTNGTIYDLEVENNEFQSCGNANAFGSGGTNSALTIYQTQGLSIQHNTFINCGDSAGGLGYVLSFYTPGGAVSSDDTTIFNNKVLQGGSTRTTKFIHKHASHTATNVKGDMNDDLGLPRDIPLASYGAVQVRALTADATANSTTTAAKITGLDVALPVGTWYFKYAIRYQAGAATTGVKFSVNHTGTLTHFVANLMWVTTGTTATSNAPSQAVNAGGVTVEGASSRAKSNAANMGPSASVDTLAADMLAIVEGTMTVTAAGNIELWHASEVAAASTVKAGTILRLERAA